MPTYLYRKNSDEDRRSQELREKADIKRVSSSVTTILTGVGHRLTSYIQTIKQRYQPKKKFTHSPTLPASTPQKQTSIPKSKPKKKIHQASGDTGLLEQYIAATQPLARQLKYILYAITLSLIVVVIQNTLLISRLTQLSLSGGESPEVAVERLVGFGDAGLPGVRVIQDFTVNKGVIDVGFNVDVNKNLISTRQHDNCKTPVPPPDDNGCGFTIVPSALGIPIRGVHYNSISFQVQGTGEARLKLDIKDFASSELSGDLGTWRSQDQKQEVLLPTRIETNEGIHIRFWNLEGDITIDQIRIEYKTIDTLLPVTLRLSDLALQSVNRDDIGFIYEDRNKDRILTDSQDLVWSCKADFPGVQPFRIDESNSVILLRDDDCFSEVQPDDWYTDDGFGALPPGSWLAVFPDNNLAFPFEISREDQKPVIELRESSPF